MEKGSPTSVAPALGRDGGTFCRYQHKLNCILTGVSPNADLVILHCTAGRHQTTSIPTRSKRVTAAILWSCEQQ
eukprot:SAG22_NODE_33_length_27588_cov_104.174652_2_plen_74_part_00